MLLELDCAFDIYMESDPYWRDELISFCQEVQEEREKQMQKAKSKR